MKRIWKRYLGVIISAGMILSSAACSTGGSGAPKSTGTATETAAETAAETTAETDAETAAETAAEPAPESAAGAGYTQHASATLHLVDSEKAVTATVDLSGGCSADFAYGAVYFYDNKTHLSEYDETTAYGYVIDKEEFDQFVTDYSGYDSLEQTDTSMKVTEEDGNVRYIYLVGDDVYFMIVAAKDDPESVFARFNVELKEDAEGGIDYFALVNKLNPLPDNWEDELQTVHMTNSVGDDVEVETKAYDAYLQLKEELEAEGVYVDLDSARRSIAKQQEIMDRFTEEYGADYAAKTVAKPGYSEHHTGLALDLYLIIDGKDVIENEDMIQYPEIWEKIHAKLADHGFILRYLKDREHITGYGYESWHIRYLNNVEAARKIMAEGLTLEEAISGTKMPDVTVDLGSSELFTEDELSEAIIKIKCDFAAWEGCELHSMRYAGDECCTEENIAWLNSLNKDAGYTKVAEFLCDFRSPVEGGGAWEPNQEYKDYQWWLGRTEDGSWDIVSTGY